MKVITTIGIMHEIKEISILYTQSVLAGCLCHPGKMRAECLLHINVSFSTHTHLNYDLSFIICYFDQNFFISCMYIGLTLCYIRYHSLARTEVFNPKGKYDYRRSQVMLLCIFSIVWLSILCRLQLFRPTENKMTVMKEKLKSRPIICVYVMYVTIRYDCMFFNIFKTLSNVLQPVLSNKVILAKSFHHYCIDEWIMHVAYEYLVYKDFCRGVVQFN